MWRVYFLFNYIKIKTLKIKRVPEQSKSNFVHFNVFSLFFFFEGVCISDSVNDILGFSIESL
jgi:hypothetical protein